MNNSGLWWSQLRFPVVSVPYHDSYLYASYVCHCTGLGFSVFVKTFWNFWIRLRLQIRSFRYSVYKTIFFFWGCLSKFQNNTGPTMGSRKESVWYNERTCSAHHAIDIINSRRFRPLKGQSSNVQGLTELIHAISRVAVEILASVSLSHYVFNSSILLLNRIDSK